MDRLGGEFKNQNKDETVIRTVTHHRLVCVWQYFDCTISPVYLHIFLESVDRNLH